MFRRIFINKKTQRNKNPTIALKTADGRTKVKLLEGVHLGPDMFRADVDAVPEPDRVAGPVVEGEPHLEVVEIKTSSSHYKGN